MPKISIIVPVYNVEKYLSRCIESILAQTFTDFELILVDDGSPDSCGKICDEYAEKDSRIKVVHKKNGGVSSARNAGLEAASGELVLFCDGDDYVAEQFCEYMQRAAAENAEAMVVCNGLKQAKENLEWRYMASEVADTYLTKQKSFYQIHKMLLSGSVCNKAFSLAKIRENGLTFNEKKPLGEDVAFAAEYCKLCEGITYIPTPLYRYVYNGGSAIRKYYPNLAELYLSIFKVRLPLIKDEELSDYCDEYLYLFVQTLENTMDKRNKISFWQKMRYNNKIMHTKEFAHCVDNASGKDDSPLFIKIVRMKNYYVLWLFQKLNKLLKKA